MKIHMFYAPAFVNVHSKDNSNNYATWEVILDQEGTTTLPFGHVEFAEFITKPTKKQLRRFKKHFRQQVLVEIERREWEQSWEGIHCDVIGL